MSFIAGYLLGLEDGNAREPVIRPLSVTENGTYNAPEGVDGYDSVYVNVPDRYADGYADGKVDGYEEGEKAGEESVKAKIQPKTITENGTYNATDESLDGYNPINVNVPDKYQDGYDTGYDDGFEKGVEYAGGSLGPIITEYLLHAEIQHGTNPWYPLTDQAYLTLYQKVEGGWKRIVGNNYYTGPQAAITSYELEIVSIVLPKEEYGHAYLNLKGWNDSHTTSYEASHDFGLQWFREAHFNAKNCTVTNTAPTDIVT